MNPIFYTLLLLLVIGGMVALGYYLNSYKTINITNADYIEAARRQGTSIADVDWGSNCQCPFAIAAERLLDRPVYVTIYSIYDVGLYKSKSAIIGELKTPFTWTEFYKGKQKILTGGNYVFTSKVKLSVS